ncbi:lysyl-tRNA synthetase, class II [Methylacidimicrobium cyclopophantes]|uniref:Lysine--tRNA ligase n=1 Tax=Methylacidimicrobium cyclopophantes TaxID=1041766 RepID=A0A5E6MIB9_9BACT|nr:lysine--tRNA ligase [Methylacidimicrobium cyclopophantes]VVM08078.1 lysyl-tRNA synthetase, class II [Methylacidimicrobium cyclopophantes]
MSEHEEASELLRLRRDKLAAWLARGIDPFGRAFPDTASISALLADFLEGREARLAGRILSIRDMGKSLFAHLQDSSGKMQIYANLQTLGERFADLKLLDLGDIVGVEGECFRTKTGEKTLRVRHSELLSKSLRPLPSKWHGLHDVEARYRQRYLDLIVNPEVRETFHQRIRIIREIRRFLEERGFLEVETPMMQPVPGGAAATPFSTFHEALGIPLYLRIAPELYLKRLLIGGFERIFELNRNFRNEGISRKHNPEFTMLEAYWAFADFERMAELLESLVCHLAETVCGGLRLSSSTFPSIDLQPPWPRKRFADCLRDATGKEWFSLSPEQRRKLAEELGVELLPNAQDIDVTRHTFEKLVEARTAGPLFVTHLPTELVPLARQNREDPSVVDVFELIIGGQEVAPGYSELNDPIVQRERLEHQVGEETQKLDEDFLLALEYGMPPAGGIGLGIDRLVMLLTGRESIRDVIFFPLLRPREIP